MCDCVCRARAYIFSPFIRKCWKRTVKEKRQKSLHFSMNYERCNFVVSLERTFCDDKLPILESQCGLKKWKKKDTTKCETHFWTEGRAQPIHIHTNIGRQKARGREDWASNRGSRNENLLHWVTVISTIDLSVAFRFTNFLSPLCRSFAALHFVSRFILAFTMSLLYRFNIFRSQWALAIYENDWGVDFVIKKDLKNERSEWTNFADRREKANEKKRLFIRANRVRNYDFCRR